MPPQLFSGGQSPPGPVRGNGQPGLPWAFPCHRPWLHQPVSVLLWLQIFLNWTECSWPQG